MNNIKCKLNGVFPPLMTPFLNQEVDYNSLKFNILKMNETKLKGFMPLGSNGEFKSLTDEESLKIVKLVRENIAADKTLIVGTGRESAWATVEFTKKVAEIGADFASILTPHYFAKQMTDDALTHFYIYVADRSPIPIMIYNAPKFASNVKVSPSVISLLAQHPNIVGMKDTSEEDIKVYVNAIPPKAEFYVLAGSISKFLEGLKVGAIGGVLSCANYLPEKCCYVQELFENGEEDKSEELTNWLKNITSKVSHVGIGGVSSIKAAMDLLGYYGIEPRLPLLPLTNEEKEELKFILKEECVLKI